MKTWIIDPLGRLLKQPAFLLCVLILGGAAVGLQALAEKMKWNFRKEAVPLRKSFDEVARHKLEPYRILRSDKIQNKEVEESLGTKDYVQWVLEDGTAAPDDPIKQLQLFITYYTGNPDSVPHVPDWCYVGGGGQIETKVNTTIRVPRNGTASDDIPLRYLEIQLPSAMGYYTKPVAYFFSVNGDYLCTRDQVRLRINNLSDRHAYFSKVEVGFVSPKLTQEQVIKATEKLMRVVVPVLVADHWPDWPAVKASEAQASKNGKE